MKMLIIMTYNILTFYRDIIKFYISKLIINNKYDLVVSTSFAFINI